jgi:hypothetical protein
MGASDLRCCRTAELILALCRARRYRHSPQPHRHSVLPGSMTLHAAGGGQGVAVALARLALDRPLMIASASPPALRSRPISAITAGGVISSLAYEKPSPRIACTTLMLAV